MNNKIAILGFAAMAMFVSCSSDDDVVKNVDIIVGNSDVEIRLGSGTQSTRASLESNSNGTFDTTEDVNKLGIFCLAKGVLGKNPDALPISWLKGEEFAVWMDNVESDAVVNADTTVTNIRWIDGIDKRYYPVGNWYNYGFYGYYPRQNYVNVSANQRTIDYVIDGTQDIIWGRTVNADQTAYSAMYFRNDIHKSEVPTINFEHKLMRLTFSCVTAEDADGSARNMRIKSVKIIDAPTRGRLIVADRENSDNEGTLTFDWNNNLGSLALVDKDADIEAGIDTLQTITWASGVKQTLGQGILLPVPVSEDYKYQVRIVLQDRDGRDHPVERPLTLQASTPYEAGCSYNVNIQIHGPKALEIKASLSQWDSIDNIIPDLEL